MLSLNALRENFVASASSEDHIYIPLQGKPFVVTDQAFDLHDSVMDFLSPRTEAKVLLLLGDTGSGKTSFCQNLVKEFWENYHEGSPLPLLISLGQAKEFEHQLIEKTLEQNGFSPEQILELKSTQRFIFILDGYDELYQFKNLYLTNHLDQWQAKVIITCRWHYLQNQSSYTSYFTPFFQGKRRPELLKQLWVAPFNQDQIDFFLRRFKADSRAEWQLENYKVQLQSIPGLSSLIQTPFLLYLAVKSLPNILAQQQAHPEALAITQTDLYDVFVEGWFERQEKKLRESGRLQVGASLKEHFWQYCKSLALKMREFQVTSINYTSKSRLFSGVDSSTDPWTSFFSEDPKIAMARSACLFHKEDASGNRYRFLHASLIDYFITRAMYEGLTVAQEALSTSDSVIVEASGLGENLESKNSLCKILFTTDTFKLGRMADRIKNEIYKRKLFEIIEKSKSNERYAIGAANAITILNTAEVSFSGMDFVRIKVPYADLRNACLNQAQLCYSDLRFVKFQGAQLVNANLSYANLEGSDLGEKPKLNFDSEIESFFYSDDGDMLIVILKGSVIIYDTETFIIKKEFSGFHDIKECALSPSKEIFVIVDAVEREKYLSLSGWSLLSGVCFHQEKWSCDSYLPGFKIKFLPVLDRNIFVILLKDMFLIEVIFNEEMGYFKDFDQAREINNLSQHACFDCDKTGEKIAVYSENPSNILYLWDRNKNSVQQFRNMPGGVRQIKFKPGDVAPLIAMVGSTGAHLVNLLAGSTLTFDRQQGWFWSCAFNATGEFLAVGGDNKIVSIWDVANRVKLKEFKMNKLVWHLEFDPTSLVLAAFSCNDSTLWLWNIDFANKNRKKFNNTIQRENGIQYLAFHPEKPYLVSSGNSGEIQLWDITLNKHKREIEKYENFSINATKNIQFNTAGNLLFTFNDKINIWDTNNWGAAEKTFEKELLSSSLPRSCISPNGKWLVSGVSAGYQYLIIMQSLETGEQYYVAIIDDTVNDIQYKPFGRTLAINIPRKKTILFLNLNSDQFLENTRSINSFVRTSQEIINFAFSPDGKLLAASMKESSRILIWSFSNIQATYDLNEIVHFGEKIGGFDLKITPLVLLEHTDDITSVSFSANALLVSASRDRCVCLWNPKSKACLIRINLFPGGVLTAAMHSYNGNFILAAGTDSGDVYLFDVFLDQNKFDLRYSTSSSSLLAYGANINSALLSDSNIKLLQQLGALGDANTLNKDPRLILIKYKYVTEITIPSKEVALRRAAAKGNYEDVKNLLDNGASINAQDNNPNSRKTALHWAIQKQNSAIVTLLLKRGADANILDARGKMALASQTSLPIEYSLENKQRIPDNTIIIKLKEKTSLSFFGVRDEEYQVDAVVKLTTERDVRNAHQLQKVIGGYGQFFNAGDQQNFVFQGVNLLEENKPMVEALASFFQKEFPYRSLVFGDL